MRNKRLAQRQKELGLEIVENNNRTFIETMRSAARMLARKKEIISNDDLRDWYEKNKARVPGPLHPNAWGAIFKTGEWVSVGFIGSEQVSRRGGIIRLWKLK